MSEVIRVILAKEVDGEVNYLFPKSSADLIVYDENNSVRNMIDKILKSKVDRISGKGLSSNDFTDDYKKKLDSLPEDLDDIKQYKLPAASYYNLGGVCIGYERGDQKETYPVVLDNKNRMYVNIPWQELKDSVFYSLATPLHKGLMSGADKDKLDGIEENANNYKLPTSSKNTLGGIKTGYKDNDMKYAVQVDNEGNGFIDLSDGIIVEVL